MEIVILFGIFWAVVAWFLMTRADPKSLPHSLPPPNDTKIRLTDDLPEKFVVFDLETTGLDAGRHEIIEIGAIRVNRLAESYETFQSFILPKGPISSRITELTGLDRNILRKEGKDAISAVEAFRVFVGDLPLVAFNAKFDSAFLAVTCSVNNLQPFPQSVLVRAKRRAQSMAGTV